MHQLCLNPDGSERLQYTFAGLPVRLSSGRLSIFHGFAAACHWHDDFEILMATDGEMDYFVNGQTVHLARGEAVFVNARRLHYGYSAAMKDCGYRFVVFHPALLGEQAPITERLERLTREDGTDYWHLKAASEEALVFTEMFAAAAAGDALRVLAKGAELIARIYNLAAGQDSAEPSVNWTILRRMTGYIQAHYTERVTLEQLAAAGAVCRSRCCALFKAHLNCTPLEYVTRYRLDKACALLREGRSVTEAALSSGFHGASYFAEVFRRAYGQSPRAYQRKTQE